MPSDDAGQGRAPTKLRGAGAKLDPSPISEATLELLAELETREVELSIRGQDLRVRAPSGVLDPALRERLREHKAELIDALGRSSRAAPLTGAQRQLWFGEQLEPGSEAHHLVIHGTLQGPVDVEALAGALRVLIARHEALRTRVEVREGVARQLVIPMDELDLDLRPALLRSEQPLVLDPNAGRMIAARLVEVGEDDTARRYALDLRLHHLAIDGVGLEVLLEELGAAYAGEQLPTIELTPGALARAAQARERSPSFARELEGWAAQLSEARTVELPSDRRRSGRPSTRGEHLRARVPPSTWAAVGALARTLDGSPFTVVAATLGLILQRWSGRERVWLGVPHANRDSPSRERVVGMLVDTGLLECDGRGDPSFAELHARTRAAWLRCLELAHVPLDRLIAAIGVRGLPDVTLNFIPFAKLGLELGPEVEVELRGSMPGARFDLTVYAYPRGGALELELAYRSELFEAGRMGALARQLGAMLEQVSAGPQRLCSSLDLSPVARATPPPDPVSVARAAMRLGPLDPDLLTLLDAVPGHRVALVHGGAHYRYAQLRAAIDAFARTLREAGVGPGARVAVYARRAPELTVALFGVWRVGAAFVILDAAHPPARLASLLQRVAVDAWVCVGATPPAELSAALSGRARVELPTLDLATHTPLSPSRAQATPGHTSGDSLAYVAFTSGTTGSPMAVSGTHAPLRHAFAWYRDHFAITADDRFALLAGLGHDPAMRDLLAPLCSGASVCIPAADPAELGPALAAWLRDEAVTTLHLTPALARVIAAAEVPLPAVRRVLFGGDRLRGSDLASWSSLAENAALLNCYGATETPQIVAMHRCEPSDHEAETVAIGHGVAGAALELRNAAGRPAGIGELAQIIVRSPYLARGYLDDYASGDLGRLRHDGAVEFVGRMDRRLSIRGHRVDPTEVEAALLTCAGVREAAVVELVDAQGERELIAWLVGVDPSTLTELRRALLGQLPSAMVPTRFGVLDALPLTANGKLDRAALRRPPARAQAAGEAARDGIERTLAAVWSALLGVADIRRDDDFFMLGGHSLLAVELVARVERHLDFAPPVTLVFEHPTLSALAREITRARAGEQGPRALTHDRPVRASPAQERLWLLQALDPDAPNLRIEHDLCGAQDLDLARLDRALAELERRHEPLRTCFELGEEGLLQRVGAPRERVLEGHPPPARSLVLDLDRGPVWRAFAWTDRQSQQRLRVVVHHIAGDAASMTVLVNDLVALYLHGRDGGAHELPRLPLRYRDLAVWQRERVELDLDLNLVRAQRALAGLTALDLPLARPRPARQRYRGARVDVDLEPALSERLWARAAELGATPFMAVLTGLVAVLARWCGTTDVSVGAPVGLRPHPAAAGLVGPFLNLTVVRVDASGDPDGGELMTRVRERALEAFSRAQLPFEALLRSLAPTQALDRTPLFQVLFNMVEAGETTRAWGQLGLQRLPQAEPAARYDLAVYALRDGERLQLTVVYDRDLFDPAQGQLLVEHLVTALEQLVEHPRRRLSQLALRGPTDTHTETRPSVTAPTPATVFERFAGIARARGAAPAVCVDGQTRSYAELLAHASAIAEALRGACGETPNDAARVGLLCEHDATMVAAMLGALAGGFTYVPLDPALPPRRLRELCEDAELAAVACVASLSELARELGRPLVELDPLPRGATTEPAPPEPSRSPAQAPAYILYTSGSTGQAKGVVQSQANLLHHALRYIDSLELGPGARVSLVASYAFDASVMDIYGALLSGALLCPISLGRSRSGDSDKPGGLGALAGILTRLRVDVFHGTPTVFRELIAQLEAGAEPPPLRWVVLGGEEARAEDARAARRHFGPSCRMINGLGPTECTLALQHRVEPDGVIRAGTLPLGRCVPGVSVRLRTPVGEQPAPWGVGEIVLESAHVALGYWRRPAQTDAVFTELGEGVRAYATGDLGSWLPDGRLRFVGRRDSQVKLRGRRIELGEIEAKLRAHPSVHEAAVDLRKGEPPRLLAFIVSETGEALGAALLDSLREQLPPWMIPARSITVTHLPKTPTGKLDRRALAQVPEPRATGRPGLGPSEDEARVLALWSAQLGVQLHDIELDRDLFAHGADSLTAVRLVRALDASLGLQVSLAELFEGATVASLAKLLSAPASTRRRDAPAAQRGASLIPPPESADSGPPLICVLPPGARTELAAALSDELARGHMAPWVLRCPSFGTEGPLPELDTITDACRSVIREIDWSATPSLIGISNGGLVALRLAQRMGQARQEIAGIALLDTIPPTLLTRDPWPDRPMARRWAGFFAAWAGLRVEPGALPGQAAAVFAQLRELALERGLIDRATSAIELQSIYAHYDAHSTRVWQVLSEFRPGEETECDSSHRYPTWLFEARDRPVTAASLATAWREVLPDLAVHAAFGDHFGMLEPPHVAGLGRALCEVLSSTDAR